MIKETCSFWCSRCKFSHPGECQSKDEQTVKLNNKLPAIGSRWYCDGIEPDMHGMYEKMRIVREEVK